MSEPAGPQFMFATGIECSYPIVTGRDGRATRIDQLELTFHYDHYQEDLALVSDLGLKYLRYGPPYYKVQLGPDRYDWGFTDAAFYEMRRLGIVPIVDLCHFGLPDWIGDFQNPEFPRLFADYARAFAERYPWVRLYTPVNEIYVCAKLSTLNGLWNERRRSDERAFVTAVKHLCRANLLAIRAILELRPDAVFVQSESAEYFHAGSADHATVERARWENERRLLPFDLLFSVAPAADMVRYLFDHGLGEDEYAWFMQHGLDGRIIMGNDFYERNEQIVSSDGAFRPAGEVFGWQTITLEYYERYGRPVMHTETNTLDADDGPRWLWKEFFNVRHLRERGVPVLGFTWYSLLDQVDWNAALERDFGVVNAVGLFDLARKPRPVAAAYGELLRSFRDERLLPKSSAFMLVEQQGPAFSELAPPEPKQRHTSSPPGPARARVAIARTLDTKIDGAGIEDLVRQALSHIGGMERFVSSGCTVLIKPNQTLWRTSKDGTTTDPRVVAALARIAREAGAGRVEVGECTSCGQVTREIMRITGMAEAAERAGAELVYFDEVEQVEVAVPRGKVLKKVPIPRPLLEADVVIACPKLKTHFMDPISGALKLWVGAARQDVMHRLHRDRVQEQVADLLTVTRPDLAVLDAIVAGEGEGPVATRGRFVGCILASDDPVALDVIAADLSGFDPSSLSFARAAAARGVGVMHRACIEIVGESLEAARVSLVGATHGDFHLRYPVRVLIGEGVTMAGTLGHFKGFADYWQKDRIWRAIVALRGKPTFMLGRIEDPDFEEHLEKGPYFVLDDAALEKYKYDPRVTFIPGSPIGNEMMPVIMKSLGVDRAGRVAEGLLKAYNRLRAVNLAR